MVSEQSRKYINEVCEKHFFRKYVLKSINVPETVVGTGVSQGKMSNSVWNQSGQWEMMLRKWSTSVQSTGNQWQREPGKGQPALPRRGQSRRSDWAYEEVFVSPPSMGVARKMWAFHAATQVKKANSAKGKFLRLPSRNPVGLEWGWIYS